MRIGISANLNLKKKTGVGEYVYRIIKHLAMLKEGKQHQFFLYDRKNLKWPLGIGWTQIRLSWEILKNKPDALFVPAHTFPLIHPKKLIVTIQGLEFERAPKCYSFWQRKKLRFLTKRNAKKSEKIIVPSKNTKNDLIELYKINPEKIVVIPHGVNKIENCKLKTVNCSKYILYLGSGHKRKNIKGLQEAYKILKEKYNIPHELVLAGVDVYVDKATKWELLKNADVFVFPSFYEGFGIPVLEAQIAGVPVIASNTSSLPEILGNSALFTNPNQPEEIAEAIYKLIKNPELREDLVKKGYNNARRFSWNKCAEKTFEIMTN